MAYLPDPCTEMENTDDSCPLIQLTSSLVTEEKGKQPHRSNPALHPRTDSTDGRGSPLTSTKNGSL